jgi:LysM repeat protein
MRRRLLLPAIAGILLITAAIVFVWNVNGNAATTRAGNPANPTHENGSSAAHATATGTATTGVSNAKGERPPTITAIPARDVVPTSDTATLQNTITHTVKAGETLFRIAHNYGVPRDALATANHISDPTQIYVGQTLIIPAVKPVPAVANTPVAPTAGRVSDNPGLITPTMGGASGNPGIVTPTFDSASSDLDIARPRHPRLPPAPTTVNGIPIDAIVVMPDDVKQHIREIYASGLREVYLTRTLAPFTIAPKCSPRSAHHEATKTLRADPKTSGGPSRSPHAGRGKPRPNEFPDRF